MFIVIITVYKIIDDFHFVYTFLHFLNVFNVSKIRIREHKKGKGPCTNHALGLEDAWCHAALTRGPSPAGEESTAVEGSREGQVARWAAALAEEKVEMQGNQGERGGRKRQWGWKALKKPELTCCPPGAVCTQETTGGCRTGKAKLPGGFPWHSPPPNRHPHSDPAPEPRAPFKEETSSSLTPVEESRCRATSTIPTTVSFPLCLQRLLHSRTQGPQPPAPPGRASPSPSSEPVSSWVKGDDDTHRLKVDPELGTVSGSVRSPCV